MTTLESPSADPSAGPPLTAGERDELVRLRHQVAASARQPHRRDGVPLAVASRPWC